MKRLLIVSVIMLAVCGVVSAQEKTVELSNFEKLVEVMDQKHMSMDDVIRLVNDANSDFSRDWKKIFEVTTRKLSQTEDSTIYFNIPDSSFCNFKVAYYANSEIVCHPKCAEPRLWITFTYKDEKADGYVMKDGFVTFDITVRENEKEYLTGGGGYRVTNGYAERERKASKLFKEVLVSHLYAFCTE